MNKIAYIFLLLISVVCFSSCGNKSHEHTYTYISNSNEEHTKTYTCECGIKNEVLPHIDENNDNTCDLCSQKLVREHKYHDYYFEIIDEAHMKVYRCECESKGFEPHFNNNGDEFCDECGYNKVGHIHTTENYNDEKGHGWTYTCGCVTPPNFAPHFDQNDDGKCDECEYMMRQYGIIYEKSNDDYSVVGFIGDEDGIIEIPDTYNGLPVRYIRSGAFYNQDGITEVRIGNNILAIENSAFMLCSNLKKVTLGNKIEVIDDQAFLKCYELEEITIPASVIFIGSSVFKYCDSLKSIIFVNPNGWYITSNHNKIFSSEEMSNINTVVHYFTDTYVSNAWKRE